MRTHLTLRLKEWWIQIDQLVLSKCLIKEKDGKNHSEEWLFRQTMMKFYQNSRSLIWEIRKHLKFRRTKEDPKLQRIGESGHLKVPKMYTIFIGLMLSKLSRISPYRLTHPNLLTSSKKWNPLSNVLQDLWNPNHLSFKNLKSSTAILFKKIECSGGISKAGISLRNFS